DHLGVGELDVAPGVEPERAFDHPRQVGAHPGTHYSSSSAAVAAISPVAWQPTSRRNAQICLNTAIRSSPSTALAPACQLSAVNSASSVHSRPSDRTEMSACEYSIPSG